MFRSLFVLRLESASRLAGEGGGRVCVPASLRTGARSALARWTSLAGAPLVLQRQQLALKRRFLNSGLKDFFTQRLVTGAFV